MQAHKVCNFKHIESLQNLNAPEIEYKMELQMQIKIYKYSRHQNLN